MDHLSCPWCDTETAAGAQYCTECGRALTDPPPPPPPPGKPRRPTALVTALVAFAAVGGLIVGLLLGNDPGTTETQGSTAPSSTAAATTTTIVTSTAIVTTTGVTTPPPTTTAPPPATWPDLEWTQVPGEAAGFGGAAYQGMWAVAEGGPGWVGVGWEETGISRSAAVWTSSDGLAWSRVPHDEAVFGDHRMYGIAAGGPGLVAVGWDWTGGDRDAAVWTSPDGLTWSRVLPQDPETSGWQRMYAVTVGGPGLVAVGDTGSDAAVWTSSDGTNWSRVPGHEEVFDAAVIWAVTAGGPGLVAVGEARGMDSSGSDAAIWTSPDGFNWTRATGSEEDLGGANRQSVFGVTVGGPGFIAVGADWSDGDATGTVWTSPDGMVWTRVSPREGVFDNGVIYGVTAVESGMVAVGWAGSDLQLGAAVWVSPDGTDWSRGPFDDEIFGGEGDQRMYGVASSGAAVVAVGYTESDDIDGAVWMARAGESDTPPADDGWPATSADSRPRVLFIGNCDPRTDPVYCRWDSYAGFRAFDDVVARLGGDLDYGVPTTIDDLTGYDTVIANFCGPASNPDVIDLISDYLTGGGGVLAMGDSFCWMDGGSSGEWATSLTGGHGVEFSPTPGRTSPETSTHVFPHPATASVESVFFSGRDLLTVTPPAETLVGMSAGPWIAASETGGRLIAVADTSFLIDTSDWYPEMATSDNFAMWHSMLAWLSQA